jgi:hypothetical protein
MVAEQTSGCVGGGGVGGGGVGGGGVGGGAGADWAHDCVASDHWFCAHVIVLDVASH